MRERMQSRLDELNRELAAGEARMRELEFQQSQLRDVVLRIAGAKQVLEELLTEDSAGADDRVDGREAETLKSRGGDRAIDSRS